MYPLLKAVEEDKAIISRENIKTIFSETESIYRLAEAFEQQLKERVDKWGPYQKLADIFLHMVLH
jgi:DNA-binding PadR family transcriptional regulator